MLTGCTSETHLCHCYPLQAVATLCFPLHLYLLLWWCIYTTIEASASFWWRRLCVRFNHPWLCSKLESAGGVLFWSCTNSSFHSSKLCLELVVTASLDLFSCHRPLSCGHVLGRSTCTVRHVQPTVMEVPSSQVSLIQLILTVSVCTIWHNGESNKWKTEQK